MRLFLSLTLMIASFQLLGQHVTFGERDLKVHANNLFFDKEGLVYPEIFIDDDTLKKHNSSLRLWYLAHPALFDSLFHAHVVNGYMNLEINERISQLNEQLLREHAVSFNQDKGTLLIAIHGFRKSFFQQNNDVPSGKEFELLQADLKKHGLQTTKHLDVYWDAMYDCCFSTDLKRNDYLFSLFDTALIQADQVGRSMRLFVNALLADQIQIVAHSLGSRVAVKSVEHLTNSAKIKVALLAAAIPGSDISEGIRTKAISSKVQWLVYYNENDFVLHKKDPKIGIIGPGSYDHGVTTLGSNKKKDALKTAKAINKFDSSIVFQLHNANAAGKCHSLRCYTKAQFLLPMVQFFLD